MINVIIWVPIILILSIILVRIYAFYYRGKNNKCIKDQKTKPDINDNGKTIAFLHPYCAGGGGGEVVLWDAIAYMMEQRDRLKFKEIVIYCADTKKGGVLSSVLKKVEQRFEIKISVNNQKYLSLIPLSLHFVIEPKYHPFATLLLQSMAAIILAFQGLIKFTPHIFIDTTGYAFTYPVASLLFGCTVISYTHYPTISSDMLQRVNEGRVMYNNRGRFRQLHLYYYKLFAILYGFCGYFADIVMVNSTWTYNHIKSIFYRSKSSVLTIVYPPCGNSEHLQKFSLKNRKKQILSVGQFRPEKDHTLQVEAFYKFRKQCKSKYDDINKIKLIMVGGVRDHQDHRRVTKLRALINKYNLKECVEIKENLAWNKLLKLFQESFIGLHTMEDEHFGICLAEYMVAGLVTIGHCSGGPLSDIVANIKSKNDVEEKMISNERGFLCTKVEQYAKCFETVFDKFENGNGWLELRTNGRKYCVDRFSTKLFQEKFVDTIEPLLLDKPLKSN